MPGDHFDLQGALELFKSAKDLEAFEKALNAEAQHVNNLDLDGNGEVDYVRVVDHAEGDAHAITMQVAVSKEETQDVAVIELGKNGAESAVLQIRGADDLYGSEVIVEPFEEKEEDPAMKGLAAPGDRPHFRVWVNVWAWPCVTWIYGPTYVMWNSPWYWGYYPPWWRSWSPWNWHAWHHWYRPYYAWYQPIHYCRVVHAHGVYQHRAMHSPTVRARTATIRAEQPGVRPPEVKGQMKPAKVEQTAKPAQTRPPKTDGTLQRSRDQKPPATKPSKPAKAPPSKKTTPYRTKKQ